MTNYFSKNKVSYAFGILMMSLFIICAGYSQRAQAQQGSLSETAYLQQLYSIMTEMSQVGHNVSKNAVSLQSAPEDKCENEFGFYQGIVSALRSKLSITVPPQRLQPLHVKSMEALSDYLTGLNLYGSACVDKDYAMKAKLFDRGSSYISKADQQITEVNSLIANPAMVPQYASSTDFVNEWCVSRWVNNIQMQEYCVATQTEARGKLAHMLEMNPNGSPGRNIISKCTQIWTDRNGSYNYRMIVFCAENQIPK
jgi:hypothetical protein